MITKPRFFSRTPTAMATLCILCACETAPLSGAATTTVSFTDAQSVVGSGEDVFFPAPASVDAPSILFPQMPGASPEQRQFFVDRVNVVTTGTDRSIPIVAQAVGGERQTLVFTIVGIDGAATPYMARALLAGMTSVARLAPSIAEMGFNEDFDIYNMAAMLGFDRIIVTDGRAFAHQASLSRP